ncbi:TNF receptor-associated factor 4-like isoform X1 [Montipora foliosa]|uniref:TNF receptor-associated factor 4-like isoform X1 n=1 Tax=Montipora foliosa TaxID=591990 RepID=UPI0035F21B59
MAEAQASLLPSGYDDKFVDAVEDDLLCPICQLPLREAVQTGVCGHRFCRQCLEEHFTRQEHDGQESKCPLDNTILNREKDIFPDKATQRKILSFMIHCPRDGCQWTGELRAKEDHENDCQRFPVNCPNGCGETIPRDEICLHAEDECPLAPIPCPYADMGCTKKVLQDDIASHIESEMRLHLDLVCVKLRDTEEELRNTEEELRDTKQLVKKLEESIDDFKNKTGVFLWKIRGFHEILQRAKTGDNVNIKSASFYTGEFGYKVRMNLYPNGNSEAKNTHLSIFIVIMKGDYDSILPWPFVKRVTFTLIDPKEDPKDRDNISCTLANYEEQDWNSRPKKGENGACRGYRKFVSHDRLMEGDYILDDTIFIEARIL